MDDFDNIPLFASRRESQVPMMESRHGPRSSKYIVPSTSVKDSNESTLTTYDPAQSYDTNSRVNYPFGRPNDGSISDTITRNSVMYPFGNPNSGYHTNSNSALESSAQRDTRSLGATFDTRDDDDEWLIDASCGDFSALNSSFIKMKKTMTEEEGILCDRCGGDMTKVFDVDDGKLLMKECLQCGHVDGKDDSFAPILDELVHNHYTMGPCPNCQNTDPNRFYINEKEGTLVVECECSKSVPIMGARNNNSPGIHDSGYHSLADPPDGILNSINGNTAGVASKDEQGTDKAESTGIRCHCDQPSIEALDVMLASGKDLKCFMCSICGGVTDQTIDLTEEANSVSNETVLSLIECICGNVDEEQFEIRYDDLNPSDLKSVKCKVCTRLTRLNGQRSPRSGNSREIDCVRTEDVEIGFIDCVCGNKTEKNFEIKYNQEDVHSIEYVKCKICNRKSRVNSGYEHSVEFNHFTNSGTAICTGRSNRVSKLGAGISQNRMRPKVIVNVDVPRRKVQSVHDLQRGDHVAWNRTLGYWHHAIVEHIDPGLELMKIIHFDGPGMIPRKGIIARAVLEFSHAQMYKYFYDDSDPYIMTAEETVERALRRLGESTYNLLTNNCEHFARWAKTGIKVSYQVDTFIKIVSSERTSALFQVAKKGIHVAVKGGAKQLTAVERPTAGATAATVGLNIAVEGLYMVKDIHKYHKEYKEEKIDRKEYVNVVVQRTAQGAGAAVGYTVGGIVGAIAIPIPVVGGVVGTTVGGLIGRGLGHLVGRQINVARGH